MKIEKGTASEYGSAGVDAGAGDSSWLFSDHLFNGSISNIFSIHMKEYYQRDSGLFAKK
ncbi:hypothetical protein [Paenibacillus sp. ISL-20]|uniref:hypothetical protein n=1 Tax=Paenibacillus sp. ISL-20 TaxID=2819163 RepID=UPI001BEB078D|nr:hypothetical protein [Paenibacillus sp. ISL-20]MBT2763953.1 hypothetical protein [Paenibacillus sp. ISL-20]